MDGEPTEDEILGHYVNIASLVRAVSFREGKLLEQAVDRLAEQEYADYWNTMVNKALELLDGAVKSEGLVIVGATNRPEEIDDAIKRSGRLETHIEIPMPDVTALAEIFAHHLGDEVRPLVRDKNAAGAEVGEEKVEVTGMTDERSASNGPASEANGEQGSREARKGAAK